MPTKKKKFVRLSLSRKYIWYGIPHGLEVLFGEWVVDTSNVKVGKDFCGTKLATSNIPPETK
jgi:hypothetical protein